jgi:RNA polymerase sigma-70 factor (ECF subfamily)
MLRPVTTMASEGSEEDLLLVRHASSDPLARDQLARRLAPRIRRLTAAFLRNRADAEDAAQAAMLEVLSAAAAFRGESRLEAWADRITVRIAIRAARARRLASVRNPADLDPDEIASPALEPDVLGALPRSVFNYLDALPEVRRNALVLRHVLGYSLPEIAELTGVSVNTVKDRLLAAREAVRKLVRREVALGSSRKRRSGSER